MQALRADSDIVSLCNQLALSICEKMQAIESHIFLLDDKSENLCWLAGQPQKHIQPEYKNSGISLSDLGDPLVFCICNGGRYMLNRMLPGKTNGSISYLQTDQNFNQVVFLPFIAPPNFTLGGILSHFTHISNTGVDQLEILSNYTASLIQLIKKEQHYSAYVKRMHEDIKKLTPKRNLLPGEENHWGIIGHSPAISKVIHDIAHIAPTNTPVLITGETGTGKEIVANAIHKASIRGDHRFVKINCAALPPSLLKRELFGYKKGSFRGARKDQTGLLQNADGGTFFFDEIGAMNLELQAKILSFMQNYEVNPLGARYSKRIDVRIIAATNRNLEAMLAKGQFRRDLYHRLAVFQIQIPPLRNRREDIPLLVEYFNKKIRLNANNIAFDENFFVKLKNLSLRGNVWELQTRIERFLLYGSVRFGDEVNWHLSRLLIEYEAHIIQRILKECDGNHSLAASRLGIPRRTLGYRIQKISESIGKRILKFA
ncbi:MAG: sigma-54 dependent transcriptional regulator [Desulfarculales bacterium]|jgi:transcriptional regulator with GAF, ATPase, and Fis domain|nr:sigma-54 dependent transcriptional regulator [Desulfarculales bacterium]